MNDEPDWLRTSLRAEAESHRPDRDRMLERVDAATAAPRRSNGRMLRVASAAAGVAAVVTAVTVVTFDAKAPDHSTAVPRSSTRSMRLSSPSSPTTSTPSPQGWGSVRPPPSTTATSAPARSPTRHTAPLGAIGRTNSSSSPQWGEEKLLLTTDRPLTALTVSIRVARTDGMLPAGSWQTVSQFTVRIRTRPREFAFRFTMNSGHTLRPGTYTFAVQLDHPGDGWVGRGDTYKVTANGRDGTHATAHGRF